MRKQRDRVCAEANSKSATSRSLNNLALKERMELLIQRVSRMDETSAGNHSNLKSSEPSMMMEALTEWRQNTSVTYIEDVIADHNELHMESLRSPPPNKSSSGAGKDLDRSGWVYHHQRTEREQLLCAAAQLARLEGERDEFYSSQRDCKRRITMLEEQLSHKDEALFVAEEARIAAEDAKTAAEKAQSESQEECCDLRDVVGDCQTKFRANTRAACAETKGLLRQLANRDKINASLSADIDTLTQDKLESQVLIAQQETKIIALVKESGSLQSSLQRALDAAWANGSNDASMQQYPNIPNRHVAEPPHPHPHRHKEQDLASSLKDLLEGAPGPPNVHLPWGHVTQAPHTSHMHTSHTLQMETANTGGHVGRPAQVLDASGLSGHCGDTAHAVFGVQILDGHMLHTTHTHAQHRVYDMSYLHLGSHNSTAHVPSESLASGGGVLHMTGVSSPARRGEGGQRERQRQNAGETERMETEQEWSGHVPGNHSGLNGQYTSLSASNENVPWSDMHEPLPSFMANSGPDLSFRTAVHLTSFLCERERGVEREVHVGRDTSVGSDVTYYPPVGLEGRPARTRVDMSGRRGNQRVEGGVSNGGDTTYDRFDES